MQAVVADMVDRFVNSEAESHAFGLQVLTVGSPNWRSKAHRCCIPCRRSRKEFKPGWWPRKTLSLILADLRRRTDFREHSSPHLLVNNGQSTVVAATQSKNYTRDVAAEAGRWPGFEPQMAQLEEGFSLEFSPLLSVDGKTIDAVIKCNVDQVEKLIAGDDRRADDGRPAAAHRDQGSANRQLPTARAVSLARRPGPVDQPGRGVVAIARFRLVDAVGFGRSGSGRSAGHGREQGQADHALDRYACGQSARRAPITGDIRRRPEYCRDCPPSAEKAFGYAVAE